MSDELKNYQSGDTGNPFASGAGQIGYENHKRRQQQERDHLRKGAADAGKRSGGSSQYYSGRDWFLVISALVAFEAIMNFTGFLTSDLQRAGAFIGAVVSFTLIFKYWDLIVKIVIGLIFITLGGALGYDALSGN